jgi:hypothetical protein
VSAVSVVSQVRSALRPEARLATALGFALGGFVPLATYVAWHLDRVTADTWYSQPASYIVGGGLLFSARTVYAWASSAFRSPAKALGFVVLLEGVMSFSGVQWLALAALAYLVAINGVATGCNLSAHAKPARDRSIARRTLNVVPMPKVMRR